MTLEIQAKVLAIDDHPANLTALRAVLDDLGVDMIEADSGEAALTEAVKHDLALILMDVRLPGIDGLVTAERLRTLDRTRDVPIIFLTAFEGVAEHIDGAYALGAVDFLIKPIIPKVLAAKVAVFVDLNRKTRAVKAQAELLQETQRRAHERQLVNERAAWEAKQLRREVELQTHLAQERERSAVVLRCIREAVVAIDARQRISLLNRAAERLFDVPSDTGQGALVDQVIRLIDPESRRAVAAQDVAKDVVAISADGQEHVVAATSGPLVDAAGRSRGTVFVYRDVTAQRRQARDTSNQQRLDSLGHFAAGIAHDFSNMLGVIMAAASILRDRPTPQEKQLQLLQDIEEACERARGVVRQLLTFSRGGAPAKRPCDPERLARESVEMSLRGGGTLCEFRVDGPIWFAQLDPEQVTQVFRNLVVNAREASGDKGRLVIRARNLRVESREDEQLAPGCYVEFLVEDDGPGIRPEDAQLVFDPYFSTKSDHRGLGLSSAHSIVHGHGGVLRLARESDRAPGGIQQADGASFAVYFPADPGLRPAHSEPRSERYSEGGHVLVVDDEPRLRELVADCLLALGCRVVQAATGEDAVSQYGSAMEVGDPFDVVVLDLTEQSAMGGSEVLKRLKSLNAEVLAIACSGNASDPIMCDPAAFGFAAAIEKPFQFAVLARTVRSLTHRCRRSDADARAG